MCIGHCAKGHINKLINAVQKKEYENPQQLQKENMKNIMKNIYIYIQLVPWK